MAIRQGRFWLLAAVVGLMLAAVMAGCGSSSKGSSGSASTSKSGRGGGASTTASAEEEGGESSEGGGEEAGSVQSGWTATTLFDGGAPPPDPELESPESVQRIACASGPFCMVISSHGESVTFDGEGFGSPQPISTNEADSYDTSDPVAISCTSSSFCLMIGEDYGYYLWDGNSWQSEGKIPSTAVTGPSSLSCPAEGQCVAVEQGDGNSASVLVYEDGNWSSTSLDPEGQIVIGVSCASADYCQILGNLGDAFTFDPSSGEPPALEEGSGIKRQIDSVSCVSGPFCIGSDHVTSTVFIDHGSGFEPQPGVPELVEVEPGACGSEKFCLVKPVSSYQYTRFDGKRLEPIAQPPGNPELEFMSCTAEEVCMASVAETDEVLVYRG